MIPETSGTHTEGFPYEIFRHRETKYFRRKIVILLCIKFFDTPIFWNFEAMSAKFFGTVRPSLFDGKTWHPPPFSAIKLFETRIFLENSRIPLRNFSALGDIKNSTENRDTPSSFRPPPLIHNFFRYQNFSDTQIRKVPPTKFFSTETKKNFDTKSWDKSLKHKIFRYPKLVTHWRFPLPNFSALWDRHFSTENRDTPSSPPPSYP